MGMFWGEGSIWVVMLLRVFGWSSTFLGTMIFYDWKKWVFYKPFLGFGQNSKVEREGM